MPAVRQLRKQGVPLAALYERMASDWSDTVARLGYPAAYRTLLDGSVPKSATRVLDVGTGTGAFAAAYLDSVDSARAPAHLTLLDPALRMLKEAESRLSGYGICLRKVDASAGGSNLDGQEFDVVLCARVLEHLEDPDRVLLWMRERLRRGGTLFLVASRPHWCTALLRWQWGHRAFRPGDMLDRLARAGFAGTRAVGFPMGPPSRTSTGYVARRA